MDIYKNFVQRLRKKEFEEVRILLSEDVTQKLKEYVSLLVSVPFEDGRYHTFYGDVKKIVSSFVSFFSTTIDEEIRDADRYIHTIIKDDLIWLIDQSITIHTARQTVFEHDFLPAKTELEKQTYEEIKLQYDAFMQRMAELKEKINKFDKQCAVENFAKEHFKITVQKTSEIFNFANTYIAMMLADALSQTRASLDEIQFRMKNNLKQSLEECERFREASFQELYEMNKEDLSAARSRHSLTKEKAEISRVIETIRDKLENVRSELHITRLQEEVTYWNKRIKEFNEIAENLKTLKAEQDNVIQSEKMYDSLKCHDLPGTNRECWKNMGTNFAERREYLKQLIVEESKALISFFAVRGSDHILYTDNVGPYYVDEFNHQVYVFDHGMGVYHINCKGEFEEFPENAYFFDKYGRFIKEGNEKVYQCAPCTSHYSLAGDGLLKKTTKDCGHSEMLNPLCRMEICDPTNVEVLPNSQPIDIKGTLDSDTVKYLWDTFGALLPDALYDVGTERPKNPIHFLAHRLLHHKYSRTKQQLIQKKKESDKYKADIFKERKEKAVAASKEWKSKQVKRRKPEESDDSEYRAAYDAHIAQQMFINSLNFFN